MYPLNKSYPVQLNKLNVGRLHSVSWKQAKNSVVLNDVVVFVPTCFKQNFLKVPPLGTAICDKRWLQSSLTIPIVFSKNLCVQAIIAYPTVVATNLIHYRYFQRSNLRHQCSEFAKAHQMLPQMLSVQRLHPFGECAVKLNLIPWTGSSQRASMYKKLVCSNDKLYVFRFVTQNVQLFIMGGIQTYISTYHCYCWGV